MARAIALLMVAATAGATVYLALGPAGADARGSFGSKGVFGQTSGTFFASRARSEYRSPTQCTSRQITRYDARRGHYVVNGHRQVCY